MSKKNSRCDGVNCTSYTGQVRLLPTGGDGNTILCRACYLHEMNYRREHNSNPRNTPVDLPEWKDLKVYYTNG